MAETAGGWGNEPCGREFWHLIGDAFGRAAAADPPRQPDPEICPHPIRVDGPPPTPESGTAMTPESNAPDARSSGTAHNGHILRPGQA